MMEENKNNVFILDRKTLSSSDNQPSRSIYNRLIEPISTSSKLEFKLIQNNLDDIPMLDGVKCLILCKHADQNSLKFVQNFKKNNPRIPIFYDIDDLIYIDEEGSNTVNTVCKKTFNLLLTMSDVIVSSNQYIAKTIKEDFDLSSVVIPTSFNSLAYKGNVTSKPSKRIIFTNGDQIKLQSAKLDFGSAVGQFLDESGYQLDIISDRKEFPVHHDRINFLGPMEWTQHKHHLKDNKYDFAIVPLISDEEDFSKLHFSFGKTPIKYFEYSAAGIPAIFSDSKVYSDVVKDGETGILVKNTYLDWFNAMQFYSNNFSKRTTLAKAAQTDVEQYHSIKSMSHSWEQLILNYGDSSY